MAAPVDVAGMKATGPAVPLEPRVAATSTGAAAAISSQGTLVYGASPLGGRMRLALVDTGGQVRYLRQSLAPGSLQFSPNGKQVVFGAPGNLGAPGAAAEPDIQVVDIATEVSTRLRTTGNPLYVSWGADGNRILAPRSANGVIEVMNVPVDGAPESRLLAIPAAGGSVYPTRDGRALIYGAELQAGGGAALLRVRLDDSGKLDTLVLESRDRVAVYRPRVSPDGRAVAFLDRNTGDVFLHSLVGGGTLQVSDFPARIQRPVVWGADSRHLFYSGANGLNIIEVATAPALRVVSRRVKPGFPLGVSYDLSPDGKTFISFNPDDPGMQLWVAVNWLDEARRAWNKDR